MGVISSLGVQPSMRRLGVKSTHMIWKDLLSTAGNSQTLSRALSVPGHKTIYQLGAGGADPTQPMTAACDCSGFVCWAIGVPRELPPGSDHWLNTDVIWAGGGPVKAGLFTPITVAQALPGDLLVYPQSQPDDHGHVGIVVQVDPQMPSLVIHCSHGNYVNYGDAVRITDPAVFLSTNHPTRVMRIDYAAFQTFI